MKTDFANIKFDSPSHTYYHHKQPLMPVTSIIKWITPEFDTEKMLKKQSLKTGRPISAIQAEWDKKRDDGLEKGTRVHNYIENIIENRDTDFITNLNGKIHEMKEFDILWKKLQAKYEVKLEHKEWTVGDVELGIAGRVDALLRLNHDGKKRLSLFDWKTGKFMTRKYTKEYMLPPFDDLPNCEEIKYSIQLSLYRLIISRNTDMDIYGGFIVHLPADSKYQLYNVIDLRDRLEKWLLQLRNNGRLGDPEADKSYNRLISHLKEVDVEDIKIISPHTRNKLLKLLESIICTCNDN